MKLKRILYFSIAVAASVSFTSCLNDDSDPGEIRPGFISFINAMPDTAALDFYVSATQDVFEQDQLGDAPISYTRRYPTSSYIQAQPYNYLLTVTHAEDDSILFQSIMPINQDVYYSVYIYSTPDSIKGIMREDNFESPSQGMAKVRFINLGKETPEVDLVAEGETTPWFSDIKFQEVSGDYEEVEAGAHMLNIKDSSTGDVLASGTVDLEDSKVYTIWVRGINEGTGQKALGLESIEHEEVEPTTTTP
ncbi:uncharacterized protein DUF4397 [Anseongella ginsenosidimutans]|uniref:Uncharacterized protein DUF4397 n=1 Tax=Anseongella ginsenosidimutans TaxID=496056 RepID=A0A4R3KR69_9SPHI|nr:DUF4397 domain-containing protein [Anseongella ginsenosidimutans]QEC52846.1 DUF4397 domain-containing protein [Anseongella ginsenosidimutans]TCS87231.1 uncharacterized protein DUF4397 [Anseongella ginsenosidimutans]